MLATGSLITLASHSYRLDSVLASSAYGLVWRAATLPAGPEVALKFVNQAQMVQAAPGQRQRWIAGAHVEAAFLRQLQPWDGRHLVRLLDSGCHAGLPVLALELLESDLGAWMARCRAAGEAPGPTRALAWIGQVNEALARVHQYGRRHLDLKPSNLLLCASGTHVKLADFGTSRALTDTAPHDYAGTPNWQAPEQLWASAIENQAGQADRALPADQLRFRTSAATDYFALGALLYYLVTGGTALRFCVAAGQARRQRGQLGQPIEQVRQPDAPPAATLAADEATLFLRHCEALPAAGGGAHALALLRALLAPAPTARPPHALAIGRLLAAALAPAPLAPSRPGAQSAPGAQLTPIAPIPSIRPIRPSPPSRPLSPLPPLPPLPPVAPNRPTRPFAAFTTSAPVTPATAVGSPA